MKEEIINAINERIKFLTNVKSSNASNTTLCDVLSISIQEDNKILEIINNLKSDDTVLTLV